MLKPVTEMPDILQVTAQLLDAKNPERQTLTSEHLILLLSPRGRLIINYFL